MRNRLILFIFGLLAWILLVWSLDYQEIIAGIVVVGIVVFIVGNIFTNRRYVFSPMRYFWFLWYLIIFIWECLKANIDVAIRVIHPLRPINPGIVKVRTSLKSDNGLTFLANSITLTPGTLTVDIDNEKGILYIHWIDVRSRDIEKNTELIVRRFEKILKKIFD